MCLDERTEQLFDTVLFMVRPCVANGTQAVIGGGAVRDAICGKPIKDIDVFVPRGAILDDLHAYPEVFPGFSDMGGGMIQYLEVKDLKRIVTLGQCGAFEIQLIEYDETKDLFDTFDIGLCRVSYGPVCHGFLSLGNQLQVSDEFRHDLHHRRLTVINPNGSQRTHNRINRLRLKYPDFTPVWPEGGFYLPVGEAA